MEKHIRALAILHIVYSSLALLAGLVVFLLLGGIGIALNSIPESEEMSVSVSSLVVFIGFVVGILLLVISLPGIIGGIGLLRQKEWARIVILVMGFFELLHVPVGTALGIYTLWALFNPDAIRVFRNAKTSAATPPQPGVHDQ